MPATIQVVDGRTVIQAGENTAEASRQAAIAVAARDTAQAALAGTIAIGNYRVTRAQGVADFAVGEFFTSDETGTLRAYRRIAAAPGYEDMGDGAAPSTLSTLDNRVREVAVNAAQFGFGPTKTAAQNLAALKAAVSATATGGTLIIDGGAGSVIDVSGGRSAAVTINRAMTITVRGKVSGNFALTNTIADIKANPNCIFNVTAAGVRFGGGGTIAGDGSFNDLNNGEASGILDLPAFIYVSANDFVMDDITMATAPKVGVYLASCQRALLRGCTFTGGPSAYNEGVGEDPDHLGDPAYSRPHTGYFGVRASAGGQHRFERCRFQPDAGGGKLVQGIATFGVGGASQGCAIIDNYADCWEKLAYTYGDHHRIENNTIENMLRTDAVRINGSYCRVVGNKGRNVLGLCAAYNGSYNEISGNYLTDIKQSAISYQRSSGSAAIKYVRIFGNTFHADPASTGLSHGITVYIDGVAATDIEITENVVVGFSPFAGKYAIYAWATATGSITRLKIDNNNVSNGSITVNRASGYSVSYNKFDSVGKPIITSASAGGSFVGNRGRNSITTPGISGYLLAQDYAMDNQWGNTPLEFDATLLSGTNSVTVARSGIAPNAFASAIPRNDAARSSVSANGAIRVNITGQDVKLEILGGANATADHSYRVKVAQ